MIHHRFPQTHQKFAAGAAYLRGMGQGQVTEVYGLNEIADELGNIVVEAKIPQIGQSPSTNQSHGRSSLP